MWYATERMECLWCESDGYSEAVSRMPILVGVDALNGVELLLPVALLLQAQAGVRPYVILQRVGDAIFLPAGCAHQVIT